MNIEPRFFNLKGFEDYLNSAIKESLKIKPHGKSQDIFSESFIESSFQFVESGFLGSYAFTSGAYVNKKTKTKGYREEFRFRVKGPSFLKKGYKIPKGKYRIKVYKEEKDEKPSVQTFVSGFLGWREKELPPDLPLEKILKGNLGNYVSRG